MRMMMNNPTPTGNPSLHPVQRALETPRVCVCLRSPVPRLTFPFMSTNGSVLTWPLTPQGVGRKGRVK